MIKYELIVPTRLTNSPTLVVGFPGLRPLKEGTRVRQQLEYLRELGHHALLVDYADITEKNCGNLLECRPDINAEDIRETAAHIAEDLHVIPSRTAIIASSMGAIPAARYLMSLKPQEQPGVFISTSPLPGWPQFLTPEARAPYEHGQRDLPVPTLEDINLGRQRIIVKSSLLDLVRVDCLAELEKRKPINFQTMSTLTIMGKHDKISSPEGMKRFHLALNGINENLIQLDSNHDLVQKAPTEQKQRDLNEIVYEFFQRYLPISVR